MDSQDQNLIIKPKSDNKFGLIIALVVLPFFAYRRFLKAEHHPDVWFNWFDFGFLALLWFMCVVALIFNKYFTRKNTITLTSEGFLRGTRLCRWHEIDQFGITTQYTTCWSLVFNRKAIFWNYRPTSLNVSASQKVTKLLSGYHDAVYSNYEIETDKLAQLLNDWRFRFTGSPADVLQGTALDKKISNRMFFFVVGLVMLVIVTFVLFAIIPIR